MRKKEDPNQKHAQPLCHPLPSSPSASPSLLSPTFLASFCITLLIQAIFTLSSLPLSYFLCRRLVDFSHHFMLRHPPSPSLHLCLLLAISLIGKKFWVREQEENEG